MLKKELEETLKEVNTSTDKLEQHVKLRSILCNKGKKS